MNKAHTNILWEDAPSVKSPINAINLNQMDNSIDVIDDRVIALDTTKANESERLLMISDVSLDMSTGVMTITKANGTTQTYDTALEKIATNFRYDAESQSLILTLPDGTEQSIDMSALITQYEFSDSSTVNFTISADGKVVAEVPNGSITREKMNPDYLAQIDASVNSASASASASDTSASQSASFSQESKSYAVGGTGTREGEDTDNARYYMEQAKAVSHVQIATTESVGIVKPDGTTITIDGDGTMHGFDGSEISTKVSTIEDTLVSLKNYMQVDTLDVTKSVSGSVNVQHVDLDKGTYIIVSTLQLATGATGHNTIALKKGSTTLFANTFYSEASSLSKFGNVVGVVNLTESTTIYISLSCTSASADKTISSCHTEVIKIG